MAGFEPAASCSQSRRANQAALHPGEPNGSLPPPRPGSCLYQPGPKQRWRQRVNCGGWAQAARARYAVGAPRRSAATQPARRAGVAQWQSPSLPSWLCGFDSRRPLPPETPDQRQYDQPQPVAIRTPSPSCVPVACRSPVCCALAAGSSERLPHRPSDRLVTLSGGMLIDQRCPRAGMSHAFHQLPQAGTSSSRHRVSGVPQIVKMQSGKAHAVAGLLPSHRPQTMRTRKARPRPPVGHVLGL
jgi:hypothetical protein